MAPSQQSMQNVSGSRRSIVGAAKSGRSAVRRPNSGQNIAFLPSGPSLPMKQQYSRALGILPLLAFAAVIGQAWWQMRNGPGRYLPHGYCFTWNPTLLWTNVASDVSIGVAYVTIPLALLQIQRKRTDIPFDWLFVLFALFIVSCGMTHWIEVWTVWNPDYWLAATVKVVTAAASIGTAIALFRMVPRVLAIPTTTELSRAKKALEEAALEARATEDSLRFDIKRMESDLRDRSQQLALAGARIHAQETTIGQLNATLSRSIGRISREFRTALGVNHEATNKDPADPPSEPALLAVSRLVEELEDVVRVTSGETLAERIPTVVGEVLSGALEDVSRAAASRNVKITVSNSLGDRSVWADRSRLGLVVRHLLLNAINASEVGQHILLSAYPRQDNAVISVRDWGRGLPDEPKEQLFEPFVERVQPIPAARGLGVGLMVSRHWVKQMAGELEVRSREIGQGAMFAVVLPLATEANPSRV